MNTPLLTLEQITQFQNLVYDYFAKYGRKLPWRGVDNPWAIFVSEVMLQQTQVERVVPKFEAFMSTFSTPDILAKASFVAVAAAWSGLGYNRRAKFLHEAAKMIVEKYDGEIPNTPDELLTLPGIGRATAASIAAFGFNKPTIFIETNIRAVFIHHFFTDRDKVSDEEIYPVVEQTLDKENPARWYSALMDYGSVLKNKADNPARRSKHHVKQKAFVGSVRQVRGAIIKELLAHGSLSVTQLGKKFNFESDKLAKAVKDLTAEGILELRDTILQIRE